MPLLLALVVAGCESLLEVSQPGAVEGTDLENPNMARMLVVGAIGKFECAVTSYAMGTGILADEFWTSADFRALNAWAQRIDAARESNGGCGSGTASFFALQQARSQSEEAYELISGFRAEDVPDRERALAQVAAYSGYSHILLGEGFCEVTLDGGPRMQPEEVLQIAEQRLSTAIDHATQAGDDDIRHMAVLGRARVRLNLGQNALAVQDASQIPEGWARHAQHSTVLPIRENRVFAVVNRDRSFTVSGPYRNLEVEGVPDPRVSVEDSGRPGQDGVTQSWIQLKYPDLASWTRIASWAEAQLIIAEAEGGQAAVDAVNRLRTSWGLPQWVPNDPNDPGEILEQVLEERRRELFAEGHRLNDMLRHDIPFPGPTDHQGATYGSMTCMLLPFSEVNNNPNL